ncbi:MAG: AAA family ATPase [Caldilineaceae bacterium SB0668_bin_21]|nr:AAA family ATPase [Caldilineaceae bacterium SB0668_bin_21]MYA98129.1 AAA family ATPase [Candidatus Poribacteria bacterium]
MIERRLEGVWNSLQGKKPHLPHFLSAIRLNGIRGLHDLRVSFDYPVSVIAGGNATGKSTVLLAAACAYSVPGRRISGLRPSTLFSDDHHLELEDQRNESEEVTIDFDYKIPEGERSMRWRHSKKGWRRNYFGRKSTSQPERQAYLRTLSDLDNSSRINAAIILSSRSKFELEETHLTPLQIEFAHQILPFRYTKVTNFSRGGRNLFFAAQESGATYSECHMAAGELAILRLSQEITQLDGALVLIDEVEACLHPWVQQLLMLHLQQLALRNDLQIIVTSHSPVILDSVPSNGKIFLDRDDVSGEVVVRPAYRDIIQNALYGRLNEKLKLLCEDEIAEGVLEGVFDYLLPQERVQWEAVNIGRDTGASEFPQHAQALRKFGQIQDTVFILDGDQRDSQIENRIQEAAGPAVDIPILYLPGNEAPESWVWNCLKDMHSECVSEQLGIDQQSLIAIMNRLDAMYKLASESPSEVMKSKFRSLSDALHRDASDICRIVARLEADRTNSDIQPIVDELRKILKHWRG